SPFRSFGSYLAGLNDHGMNLTGEMLEQMVLEYLLTKQDTVQKFHMQNGAAIGAIRLEANAPGSADALEGGNVMIVYVYSRDEERCRHNAALFAARERHHMPALFTDERLAANASGLLWSHS